MIVAVGAMQDDCITLKVHAGFICQGVWNGVFAVSCI